MPTKKRHLWVDVKTWYGLPADQVISALQKEIWRGHTENAVLLAYEMAITSPALEDYLWQRMLIISVEDMGFGEPRAPVLVNTLRQMAETLDHTVDERKLFAIHAVRYLCGCQKDHSSDEMFNWAKHAVERGDARPEIPDYALDMHTAEGRAMGRGRLHFYEEGAKLLPELPDRELTYRRRLMEMLDKREME